MIIRLYEISCSTVLCFRKEVNLPEEKKRGAAHSRVR